jgi:hypothetical protein
MRGLHYPLHFRLGDRGLSRQNCFFDDQCRFSLPCFTPLNREEADTNGYRYGEQHDEQPSVLVD